MKTSIQNLLSIIFLSAFIPALSQDGDSAVEKIFSENTKHKLVKIIPLQSGGYLVAGHTLNGSEGGYDIFLQQIDNDFNIVQEEFFGSESDEFLYDAIMTEDGNILLYGKKAAVVNNTPRWSVFFNIQGLDGKKGTYQEYISYKSDSISRALELEKGNIVFVGNKMDRGDYDQNIWFFKINKKGIIQWQINPGERYIDEIGKDVVFDGTDFYLLAELRNRGKIIPLLLKTDMNGNLLYRKEIQFMDGYSAERMFLNENNQLIIFGSKKSSKSTEVTAFKLDRTAREISETTIGSIDNDAQISFTGDPESIYILSSYNGKGCIYNYMFELDRVGFMELTQNMPVQYVKLVIEGENFLAAGNADSEQKSMIYMQKSEMHFTDPDLKTDVALASNDDTEPEDTSIEIIEPSNSLNKASVSNKNTINLQAKVSGNTEISRVDVNGKEMLSLGDRTYSLNYNLNEGINQCRFTAVDVNGQKTVKFLVIENTFNELAKGKNFALIMTVNEYADPAINDLDNPKNDGDSLVYTLQTLYTFDNENTFFLVNPTREEIITKFDELVYEIGEEDNFLVFFAGHGYWDKKTNIGYWLPSDAKKSNTANWLSNSTIKDFISAIPSKHTLLIADACFSGGIFKTRKAFNDNLASVDKLYELPSRKAMTSGTLTEVPDKSVFIEYLIKRLKTNDQKYISSEVLFSSMRTAVLNNSDNVPQYGEIKDAGDEGGDFIFIRRED